MRAGGTRCVFAMLHGALDIECGPRFGGEEDVRIGGGGALVRRKSKAMPQWCLRNMAV